MTSLYRKPLDQINKADLQEIINDQVQESKTIDYKRDLILNTDEQKKEFLADISSFANAIGGHLIYGVVEEKGIPKQISGLEIRDIDKEIGRLENIMRRDRAKDTWFKYPSNKTRLFLCNYYSCCTKLCNTSHCQIQKS
jgi:hypothetical protein